MDTVRDAIDKENTNRGTDPNIPLMGSTVKRKRLSDITNIVSSSRVVTSRPQFRENTKEVACGITKECVTQLIEENATLLKAIGERNKIIELSSMELQKLRFTMEKANQQNRLLAQTNSQMLAELTSSKERLKVLQHELGCTVAVLKFKNSALDEKEKLIKELSENTRVVVYSAKVECSKIDEEDTLNDKQCVKTKYVENYKCPKVTTGASLSHSVNTSTWIPDTERTFRSKSFTTSSIHHQAKEKPDDESHEKNRAEEQSLNNELCEKNYAEDERLRCTEVASDVMRPHVLDNVSCEPNKKRGLITRSVGAINMTHQAKTRETDAIRKSSRRRSENMESQVIESKDSLSEDANIPACSMTSELPNVNLPDNDEAAASVNHTTKATEKDNRRKSTRRTENLTSEPRESRADLHEIMFAEIPACPIISEQMNEECHAESVNHITKTTEKDNRRKSSRRRSENLTYEPRESKTDLHEIMYVVNEECPVKPQSSAILTHKAAEEEDAKRCKKSSRMRSNNNLKPESCESNDQFTEAGNLIKPAFEAVVETQIETSLPSDSNGGKDGEESRRTSVCRPSRKAAEKVSSYKEVPLKCKMRRPE